MTPLALCHACPDRARPCPCPCPKDGYSFALHAAANYCPVKRYGDGVKPDGWDEQPKDAQPVPRRNDVERVRAVCEGCEHLVRVQSHGKYVECKAVPGCGGCGSPDVSLLSGFCPKGKWG